jgi:hypothetical protein
MAETLYQRRIRLGLCGICGHKPDDGNHKLCERCLAQRREAERPKRLRRYATARKVS